MSQARDVLFTLNNPELPPEELQAKLEAWTQVLYFIFQLEEGENGTPHFQGFAQFKSPKKFSTVLNKLSPRLHLEKRRGTPEQAKEYCSKEDTRQGGPWEGGEFVATVGQGTRSDLKDCIDTMRSTSSLKAAALAFPETFVKYSRGLQALYQYMSPAREGEVSVRLLFGPPGTGKTRHVIDSVPRSELFIMEPGSKWFDGYDGHPVLLLDDFVGAASGFRLDYTLRLLDRYEMRLPIKGAHTYLTAKIVYITTNLHPETWFDWNTRIVQLEALKRRFSEIWYFPDAGEKFQVDKASFFNNYQPINADDYDVYCLPK